MNFLKLILSAVVLPLVEKYLGKFFAWLGKWFKRKNAIEEKEQEVEKKVEDFKNAETKEDIKDTFGKLP